MKNLAQGMIEMYKKDNGQITIAEFKSSFGKLDKENRWVKISDMIPWRQYEEKYAEQFCANNGTQRSSFGWRWER